MTVGVVAFVLVVVVMVNVRCQTRKLLLDGVAALHSSQELLAVKNVPRSCYNGGCWIFLAQECDCFGNLFLVCALRMRQNDTAGIFDLVIEELAKVLHIHLALFDVCDRGKAVENDLIRAKVLHSADNIRKLANARGLDKNAVGVILVKHLFKCFAKVTYQGAANATAVHFGYFNACVLHKTAVNTNLAKFVFNQHQLFTGVRFV